MSRSWKFRIFAFALLLCLGFISGAVYKWPAAGQSRSRKGSARGEQIDVIGNTPVFEAVSDVKAADSTGSDWTVTPMKEMTIDLDALGIHPTKAPVFKERPGKSSTVGRTKNSIGVSNDITNQNININAAGGAFGLISADWTVGETVTFSANGGPPTSPSVIPADGVLAFNFSTGAGFGYITFDEVGTSGKEAGTVIQVAPTGPYLPGVASGPHAINTAAATPTLRLYGFGYTPNLAAGSGVNIYRNGVQIANVATSAAGRYNVTLTSPTLVNNGNTAAVYSSDLTGVPGSFAAVSVEERSDAGTPPTGDQNQPRAFVDRSALPIAGGSVAIVGENFAATETVTVSGCASGSIPADSNGSVGFFVTAPAGAAVYTCTLTGGTTGRVARAAFQAQANSADVRSMIVQPSLAKPGGAVTVLTTGNAASNTGSVFLDGVSVGPAVTNASGNGSVTITKPATGYIHSVGWITDAGTGDAQVATLQIAPNVTTASSVSVDGRVVSADGRGVTNAKVTIADSSGMSRTVITGRYGTFRLMDVEPGRSYVISVASRRFNFAPQLVEVSDNVSGLIFTASRAISGQR